MGVSTAVPEQTITSALWNELAGLVNGTAGSGEPVQFIDYSSSTNPSLSVRNQNTSGTAFRVYNGTLDLISAVNTGTNTGYVTIAGLRSKGGIYFDITAYGAVADDTSSSVMTANVAAIQAAINAAALVKGTVYIPPGTFSINAPLTMTEQQGMSIAGASPAASTINYVGASSASCVLDMTGSQYCCLANWQITVSLSSAAVLCAVQILGGSTTPTASTANSFYRFHASTPAGTELGGARCSKGLIYAYGAGDAVFVHCNFNQSAAGRYTINCVALSTTVTSDGITSSATIGSGTNACSDWTFLGTEIHNTGGGSATMKLGAVSGFRFIGGPLSNSQGGYAHIHNVSGAEPNKILFYGCTMYREGSNPVTANAFEITGTTALTAMEVVACNLQCTASVFGDTAATATPVFDGIYYRGVSSVGAGGHANIFNFSGSSATVRLSNSDIWCEGKAVTINGTIAASTTLHNPGTVTTTGGSNLGWHATTGTTANTALAGNSVSRQMHTMSPAAAVAVGTTYYGWDGSVSATDANYGLFPAPFAGTAKNLYVVSSAAPGAGQTYAAALYKNGSASTVSTAISNPSTTANDTTHSVTFSAGDTLQLRLVTSSSAALNNVMLAVELQAAPTT